MIGSTNPEMVSYHIIASNFYGAIDMNRSWPETAYTEEEVCQQGRVVDMTLAALSQSH